VVAVGVVVVGGGECCSVRSRSKGSASMWAFVVVVGWWWCDVMLDGGEGCACMGVVMAVGGVCVFYLVLLFCHNHGMKFHCHFILPALAD
jgi:hypothetical protein